MDFEAKPSRVVQLVCIQYEGLKFSFSEGRNQGGFELIAEYDSAQFKKGPEVADGTERQCQRTACGLTAILVTREPKPPTFRTEDPTGALVPVCPGLGAAWYDMARAVVEREADPYHNRP